MTSVVLAVTLPSGTAGAAVPSTRGGLAASPAQADRSVPVTAVPVRPPAADPVVDAALRAAPAAAAWPKPGSSDVDVSASARQAGDLPVWVSGAAPMRVRVELLDSMMLRIDRTDGVAAPGQVTVELDYSGFADAFGGDYGSRLTIDGVQTRNNPATKRLSAVVTTGPQTYAVTAAASGAGGSYKATPLSPSATWQAGDSSGSFAWSYGFTSPPMPGQVPSVGLAYSSGSLDGRTFATNNQPSWVGEGFDLSTGYIERSYVGCADDMSGGSNTSKTGDLCWSTYNGKLVQSVTLVLGGNGGELVRDDATGTWRVGDDEGWRVELLAGTPEYWRLTSPDGTQYFFGRYADAQSTWTVPVYGNHPGEPCRGASFDASWCQQPWRWNLDFVVDTHGDVMSYHYQGETNYYGRNNTASKGTPYTRGGYLTRIDYGTRDRAAPAPARMVFTPADRCLTAGADCVQSKPANWPDVPWDMHCATTTCTGKLAPTFWTTKRLARVASQLRKADGTYSDVDSWTLSHLFPATGDTLKAALWLESIVHTGHVGGEARLPEVNFDGVQLANRVDGNDMDPLFLKWRVNRVRNETGGELNVTYSGQDCAKASLPVPDSNTRRCFPQYWTPEGAINPILGWFHKYAVTKVAEVDRTGGAVDAETHYEYIEGGAWHYDDSELTPAKYKTWGQWRGFGLVRVIGGAPTAADRTVTETRYLRGMDNDRKADGTRKDVWVGDSQGGRVEDHQWLAGRVREQAVLNGVGGAELAGTVTDWWFSAPTASRARATTPVVARMVDTGARRTRTALTSGGARRTEVRHEYDSYGVTTATEELGDTAVSGDESCGRTSFARDTARWILTLPAEVRNVSVPCAATATNADVVSIERHFYDGSTALGTVTGPGNETREEELSGFSNGQPVFVTAERATYDAHGRVVDAYDALNYRNTTTYTPATGGPVTAVTKGNALGHANVSYLEPGWGTESAEVDENGRRTDLVHDPLGRLVKVWLPGRDKTSTTPNLEYSYTIRTDAPNVVTTRSLRADGGYNTSYEFYDGLLRARQAQEPAPNGGRLVTESKYDSHGRAAIANGEYFNSLPPAAAMVTAADNAVPAQTLTLFDGGGRARASVFRSLGVEKWRSTNGYGGDRVSVDPPEGDTATMRLFDVDGRVTELRQFHGGAPTGPYDSTSYGYTRSGELSTVTDPAGNVWRYDYDQRGRRISASDPDSGTSTMGYDDEDRLVESTDARGVKLAFTYDAIDRRTGVFLGSTSGMRLLGWTFDTLAKGELTSSTRYVNGNAYTTSVLGYDAAGETTGVAYTLPAAEGALAGRYEFQTAHDITGQVSSMTLPAAGGLPAETLTYGYDSLGLPKSLTGLAPYVRDMSYTGYGEPLETTSGFDGYRMRLTRFYEEGTRRLTRTLAVRESAADPVVADVRLRHDASGNVLSIADTPSGQAADVQCFRYDYLGRLTEAWTPGDNCAGDPSTAGLTGPAPYWHSYRHDVVGNRTQEVRHSVSGDRTSAYTYPVPGSAQPHALRQVTSTGGQVDEFAYDPAGNTLSRKVSGVTQTLEWDAQGQLASVTENGKTTSFVYDASGERLLRRDPDGVTLYLGETEVYLHKATGVRSGTRYYGHDSSGDVAVRTTANGLHWLVSDHNGSDIASIDAEDLSVTRRRYLPYGELRGTGADWSSERGFVGGTVDASTGTVHLGAREYDTGRGRFTSVDPVMDRGDPQQMQGYAYANNAAPTLSDADGQLACGWFKRFCSKARKAAQAVRAAIMRKLAKHKAFMRFLAKLKAIAKAARERAKARERARQARERARAKAQWRAAIERAKKAWGRTKSILTKAAAVQKAAAKAAEKKFLAWRWNRNADATGWALNEALTHGGMCSVRNGRMYVCTGVKGSLFVRKGGVTVGSVFMTWRSTVTDEMMQHEDVHATQAARAGSKEKYLAQYLWAVNKSRSEYYSKGSRRVGSGWCHDADACYNWMEVQAGLERGGYVDYNLPPDPPILNG
ncbi:MAG TPA: RHS repeat-associated core domain-containing protein [Candidatus Limnocylindrales bacterium]